MVACMEDLSPNSLLESASVALGQALEAEKRLPYEWKISDADRPCLLRFPLPSDN